MTARRRPASLATALLLLALAPSTLLAQRAAIEQAILRFQAEIARDVEADSLGGITAAVVIGERVAWTHGFGWADRERRVPAAPETIYRIGSISKSVTAVTMMRLAERGVLSLDDRADRWLPELAQLPGLAAEAAPITIRQLASHTGGLIREPELEGAAAGPIDGWEARIIESIRHTQLRTPPGTEYSYSNIGYGILGLTISRAARTPFMGLVRDLVFEPLGMTSSFFIVPAHAWPRVATGYLNNARGEVNTELPAREHAGRGYKVPNGGVYSTVADLARFSALMNGALDGRVLSAESRQAMLAVYSPGDTTRGYGLGFMITTDEQGRRFAHHSGSVAGYTANILFHPDTRIGVILLRNYNAGRTNLQRVSLRVAGELIDAIARSARTSTRLRPPAVFTVHGNAR
jgi:CubicO group peptidase (beta-lactamase class C family)